MYLRPDGALRFSEKIAKNAENRIFKNFKFTTVHAVATSPPPQKSLRSGFSTTSLVIDELVDDNLSSK